ncbi:MAG: hypothetical protein P8Y63_06060 [Deltaproteobacteria bacterium]
MQEKERVSGSPSALDRRRASKMGGVTMEQLIFPVVLTLAGAFFLVRNMILLRNEAKLANYIQTSPKAKLWVRKYGVDKTIELSKNLFLPLGMVVSTIMFCSGFWISFTSFLFLTSK